MNQVCWWCVDRLSRMLESAERDAVRGDLAESGETGYRALQDVLGLVLRRQAALWRGWRPWVALVFLVLPIGYLLSFSTLALTGGLDVNLWIIRNHQDMDSAVLRGVLDALLLLGYQALLMLSRAWVAGYVLGHLSRRTIRANAALFGLVLLVAQVVGGPRYRFYMNLDKYSVPFLTVLFPLILLIGLIGPATFWGLRRGLGRSNRPLTWIFPVVVVISDLIRPRVSPVAIAVNWPTFYVLATILWRKWEDRRHYLPE